MCLERLVRLVYPTCITCAGLPYLHLLNLVQISMCTHTIRQRTAAHCSALQRTAALCNALQCVATHCNALQRTAKHCSALQRQYTAKHRKTLQHTAAHCNALQRSATHTHIYLARRIRQMGVHRVEPFLSSFLTRTSQKSISPSPPTVTSCLCACVCVRERKRERERESVCVCVKGMSSFSPTSPAVCV